MACTVKGLANSKYKRFDLTVYPNPNWIPFSQAKAKPLKLEELVLLPESGAEIDEDWQCAA